MKVEMLCNWGGLKKGSIYTTNEKTANFLIGRNYARTPITSFLKRGEKADVPTEKPKRKRSLKK
jgi:hypothetical protein